MTDKDIIKALECCSKAHGVRDCISLNCPLFDKERHLYLCIHGDTDLFGISLDLINRQKAEIDNSNHIIKMLNNNIGDMLERQPKLLECAEKHVKKVIKEFAERLKIYSCRLKDGHDMVDVICIDNLVKEMVGENNAE